jgi:hypothetical protein
MKKFTKFESAIIIDSLKFAKSTDLAKMQEAVEAGKNPLFTAEYVEQTYDQLVEKVKESTVKK